MKKIILFILMILFTTSCSNYSIKTTDKLSFNTNVIEYGQLIKLSDIIENDDITYDDFYLEVDNLGKNKVKIDYKKKKIKYYEYFEYEVLDTTSPLIYIGNTYSVNVGYTGNIAEDILCVDNYDKKTYCYITGGYDVYTPGSYPLTITAEDENKNVTKKDFTLLVNKKTSSSNTSAKRPDTLLKDVIDKYKNDNTKIGIDVSKYQGDIDFEKVKNAGVEFVIIRLGYQYYFNDKLELDPYFKQNIENATKAGLDVGIYFYSYALTEKEAIEQANFVIDNIKDYKITMPIAFDWENFKYFNELSLSLYDLRKVTYAFQDTIKNAGYTPVNYGSKNYLNNFLNPNKYDVWLAHYGVSQSDYQHDYVMWQLCDNGKVDGINAYVDINVYYK